MAQRNSSGTDTSAVRGRGAQSARLSPRLSPYSREDEGDWRDSRAIVDGPAPKLRTQVTEERPRSILTTNRSPDLPFDRSINAYRGCEHGCIYCYARPTHAFHDLSPGLDFETKLFAKPNAAALLREALARPGYRVSPIAMGTNTDPYQPIERRYRITRAILELCLETRHPVTITTKSDRILDDLDLLKALAQRNLVAVAISVTSLDPRLSRKLEPRAAAPAKRLAAIERLTGKGVPVHLSIAPVIPALTDDFLEEIVARGAQAGARSAGWILLRLPHEVAPLFREWLDAHFPERASKVLNILRTMRAGKDNDPRFFERMRPRGVWADLIRARFALACKRAGIEADGSAGGMAGPLKLDRSRFRPPERGGQLPLL